MSPLKRKAPRRKKYGGIKRTKEDAAFSLLVRERDNWTCQRCDKRFVPPTRALHAAHCFGRRKESTRHDPENAVAACYGCHQYLDEHPNEKYELFRLRLGDEAFDALRLRSQKPKKGAA